MDYFKYRTMIAETDRAIKEAGIDMKYDVKSKTLSWTKEQGEKIIRDGAKIIAQYDAFDRGVTK